MKIQTTISSDGLSSWCTVLIVELTPTNRLDHGAGKDLSLKECSREQLETEVSIIVVSTIERLLISDHSALRKYHIQAECRASSLTCIVGKVLVSGAACVFYLLDEERV